MRPNPARDMTGALRWILVESDGSLRWLVHYPTRECAERFACPGQRPEPVRITGRAGPFSDSIERLEAAP